MSCLWNFNNHFIIIAFWSNKILDPISDCIDDFTALALKYSKLSHNNQKIIEFSFSGICCFPRSVSILKQHGDRHRIQKDLSLMIIKTENAVETRGTRWQGSGGQLCSRLGENLVHPKIQSLSDRLYDIMEMSGDIGPIDQNRGASTSFVFGPI